MMQVFTKKSKGFTLIELLVVIAIIGILAGIVLVSLGGARTKAKDGAIKANMDTMRLALEMHASSPANTYVLVAGSDEKAAYDNAKAAATVQCPLSGTQCVWVENTTTNKYCIQLGTLPGGGSWCLDSSGYVGSASVFCDATWDCATD